MANLDKAPFGFQTRTKGGWLEYQGQGQQLNMTIASNETNGTAIFHG